MAAIVTVTGESDDKLGGEEEENTEATGQFLISATAAQNQPRNGGEDEEGLLIVMEGEGVHSEVGMCMFVGRVTSDVCRYSAAANKPHSSAHA